MIQRSKPIRRTAVKRSDKPIARSRPKAKRAKPRRGQPTPAEKKAIRDQVYDETGGKCEINKHLSCVPGRVWPSEGSSTWDHWHLVHLKAKRVHGWDRENLCGGCPACHLIELHNPKSVPPKERP